MILCFSCSPSIKTALDELVLTGGYRDYGDAISAAVSNLQALHAEMKEEASLVLGEEVLSEPNQTFAAEQDRAEFAAPSLPRSDLPSSKSTSVPGVFAWPGAQPAAIAFAEVDRDTTSSGTLVPVDDWIFGQFNRLLPVKATCRALINLCANGDYRQPLDKLALRIADEATGLSRYLGRIDKQRNLMRDESLVTAFPKIGGPDSFKSVQRFATQFVGSINRDKRLLGLPAALKLIGKHPEHTDAIALTPAGMTFGLMRNPLLDKRSADKVEKFSSEEIDFLIDHIRTSVPVEAYAFTAILREVSAGKLTPDDLDRSLSRVPKQRGNANASFISTQRSGAISRMADLDLIGRNRSANRVSYVITPRGTQFLLSARK